MEQQPIKLPCLDCGEEFEQPAHLATGQAFYYVCPLCRAKAHEQDKKKPARQAGGMYRGIKRKKK